MQPAEPLTPTPGLSLPALPASEPPPRETRAGPVPVEERVAVIDTLRGIALFGIITANMLAFNSPLAVYFDPQLMWSATPDRIAQTLIDIFIRGKFITLFSLLFGLGFAIQFTRAEMRGGRFAGFYSRRLLALLAFGAAHSFLLWWGDILFTYALVGFLLLLFRKRRQKTIMIWASTLYWFPTLLMLGFLVASWLGAQPPAPKEPSMEELQKVIRVYAEGTYAEIFQTRLKEWGRAYSAILFFFPWILALFLAGLYIWRRGILQDIPGHLPLIRRALKWGLVLGLTGNLAAAAIIALWHPNPMAPSLPGLLMQICSTIGVPMLSLGYASAVILLFQTERWRRLLMPFSAVGRMALTNYLLQTVVCTTLFYSYGFGLYGKVGPLLGLVPTFIIYGLQVPLSAWWLARYRFGPMEWLWRCLTYGSGQPFRRQPASVVEA